MIRIKFQMDRIGLIMIFLYLGSFIAGLYPSITIILGDQEILIKNEVSIPLVIMGFFNSLTLMVQLYFVAELRRVRIWLESQNPSQLKQKLATHQMYKWILVGAMIVIWSSSFLTLLVPG